MSGDSREEQWNELEALRSVYEDSHVIVKDDEKRISGQVSIELPPLSNPVSVFSISEEGRYSVSLSVLPPVRLKFHLPQNYPAVPPELEIECEWMDEDLVMSVESKLQEVCNENLGIGVLYFCCETVIDVVQSKIGNLDAICLDNAPYGRKNKLRGHELVKQVADSSLHSEDLLFKSACYDCEICFENKMGFHCVQFKPCMHVFCKDCVSNFFMERLNSLEMRQLGCPASECESTASEQTVRDIIGEEAFERYDRILLERSLGQMSDVVICPRKTCQNPAFVSERTVNLGSCGICGYSFCILCFRAYHGVNDCKFTSADKRRIIEEWKAADQSGRIEMAKRFGGIKNLQNFINVMLNDGWIEGNSKPCPRCGVRIEKNHGCNMMHCTKCEAMFCWLCGRILDKNSPYAHFDVDEGNCMNRLFEGIVPSDSDDEDEDVVVEWANIIPNENDSDNSDFEREEAE